MDTMARSLLAAHAMLSDGVLSSAIEDRYSGWSTPFGTRVMAGKETLGGLRDHVLERHEPERQSGRQELLENIVARYVERAR
jgi:xylose isomerase